MTDATNARECRPPEREDGYYIVDLRKVWTYRPYVSLWRPDNKGYCYSIPWAGVYSYNDLTENGYYYNERRYSAATQGNTGVWDRFSVACNDTKDLLAEPSIGIIDGNVGPVLPNTPAVRKKLRAIRVVIPCFLPQEMGGRDD